MHLDTELLRTDEEGRALLSRSNDKRAYIEQQRRQHEMCMREQKDLMGLLNRVKAGSTAGEELIKECAQVFLGKQHPTMAEIERVVRGAGEEMA